MFFAAFFQKSSSSLPCPSRQLDRRRSAMGADEEPGECRIKPKGEQDLDHERQRRQQREVQHRLRDPGEAAQAGREAGEDQPGEEEALRDEPPARGQGDALA
jgi:hypothetical protein